MFSKKMLMIAAAVFLIAMCIIFLSISIRRPFMAPGASDIALAIVGPFQATATRSIRSLGDIWKHYFSLVSTAKENESLKRRLSKALEMSNRCEEIELSNARLRHFLNFQKTETGEMLAAEVISKDSSNWFKTIIINKGSAEGVKKGMPALVPEGIVGQIINVSDHYSKVLLVIDVNSAVDGLVQRSRARGIIKGESIGRCFFKYVLRKNDVLVGDTVVSSGLDGVYPKGLRIGKVSGVLKRNSGIFQEVIVEPYVDFDKLEEVLVMLNPPAYDFVRE